MIKTEFISATDTLGARIRATAYGRQITRALQYDTNEPHRVVAVELAEIMGYRVSEESVSIRRGYRFSLEPVD